MLSDTDTEHSLPRLITLGKNGSNCGFQLTRGKWDPYPWVSSVEPGSTADLAGLRAGDCLLEVNGEDVLGRRISEVAEVVKSKPDQVSLLLWNAGVDSQCSPEAICCGPMPTNLQRLSACMSAILTFLECPVCLDTTTPPSYQCENGHLICLRCRTKSERCPVCRLRFTRSRSLLADQVYNALIDSFNLREEPANSRNAKMQQIFKKNKKVPEIKITPSKANKFFARIVGKSTSVENLKLNDQDGFNLKSKSLSTNEIFASESPVISRTSSISRLGRIEKNRMEHLSASCHGSFESLQRCDEEMFHCPFTPNCFSLIKGKHLIEHFQLCHDGPLMQFFKPNIQIKFQKIIEYKYFCYLVQIQQTTFFLKIEVDNDHTLLLWTWILDNSKVAKEYNVKVKLLLEDEVMMSFCSPVLSLSSTPYCDIKQHKKGVLINAKSIDSLQTSKEFIFDIFISKSDNF